MTAKQGSLWLENAVFENGYLNINPGCNYSFHTVQKAIRRLGSDYNHDSLIAKLTLGFWCYQFSAKEFAASGSVPLNVFPGKPFGIKQKDIFQKLIKINEIRNRIAHHEPICFHEEMISTYKAEGRYKLILELLGWLGYRPEKILYGINGVRKEIKKIDTIIARQS